MATQRFLGTAWATVHGPAEPAELLVWVLEQGFRGLGAGPGPRAVDWQALRAASASLPVAFAAVRVSSVLEVGGAGEGNLASSRAGDRAAARRRVERAVLLARRLGCPRVVLEPGVARPPGESEVDDLGDAAARWTEESAAVYRARCAAVRDAALDAACRALYEIARAFPDIAFCLTPSRHPAGLGEPLALVHLFEDLASVALHYWHDAALAARRQEVFGTPQGEWLERFSNRLQGFTLGDSVGGSLYLPPGTGGVDYPLLASYRRRFGRPVPAVVELDPAVEPAELPGAHAFLSKHGL